jgi:hypothetical protein
MLCDATYEKVLDVEQYVLKEKNNTFFWQRKQHAYARLYFIFPFLLKSC